MSFLGTRLQALVRLALAGVLVLAASGCDSSREVQVDAMARDASGDGSRHDGSVDADTRDTGPRVDTGVLADTGVQVDMGVQADTGVRADIGVATDADVDLFRDAYVREDAARFDAGRDAFASVDAFVPVDVFASVDAFAAPDALASVDAFLSVDAFVAVDASGAGSPCVSGTTGTHLVRFRWAGSGPGSTAYVVYEANTLPDTSLWRVTAASMSIGFTPRFDDTFLGVGGLDLSGTVFIDVQLSTAGLSSIGSVSIGVFGRSFATTASGSFTWQTFTGTGATPNNSVANSAPYEWYRGDATSAFAPGDPGVRLRLRAGPSSSALIVNRVEVCFTAI